ncbi:hypothetical protein [Ferrovum sp.]|uniref:type II toxin-antitoxin system RelE/ParE family toxin n=1 Tax=Ferrovum sp. TaxID=2609467 RepID=UPI00260299A6|nr:hypothetical protein [Ferrovum sp.]
MTTCLKKGRNGTPGNSLCLSWAFLSWGDVQCCAVAPERSVYPKELLALGIRDYRQTAFKPYQVIYRVMGQKVYIYVIADGRRDMQSLLARRLLGV